MRTADLRLQCFALATNMAYHVAIESSPPIVLARNLYNQRRCIYGHRRASSRNFCCIAIVTHYQRAAEPQVQAPLAGERSEVWSFVVYSSERLRAVKYFAKGVRWSGSVNIPKFGFWKYGSRMFRR